MVDFIDLRWWPVFNLADSAVVVGVMLLIIASILTPTSSSNATS
ncbi:MAG TPA: signal peptidase II [Chloroflexota bacterium]